MDKLNWGNPDLEPAKSPASFVRSNVCVPRLHGESLVDVCGRPWTLSDLKRLPKTEVITCFECAGNSRQTLDYETEGLQWDNTAVANVKWAGVKLADILPPIPDGTVELVFDSYDNGFARSLPIKVPDERPVLLAYEMNNKKLPDNHGFPVRVVVPGWYGVANVKWLKKVSFSSKPFEGEYQTRKYTYRYTDGSITPVAEMLPKSLVLGGGSGRVWGKAWSGHPVSKVEVVIDGGTYTAEITQRQGRWGWVAWELDGLSSGTYIVGSRAFDDSGSFQPAENVKNKWGYGNNAVQYVNMSL